MPAPKVLRESPDQGIVGRCVVQLVTTAWNSTRGLYQRRDLLLLRRKCKGYPLVIMEDAQNGGTDQVFGRIVNLGECKDGVYEVNICNQQTDWETGIVDDFDYQLIPFQE